MEYGLHESLPIYSGGLGVLAGDHLKTASDLGLPLVGVGLAYAEGYFRQVLNDDGWQGERYPINDWHRLPVQPVIDAGGKRLIIRVAYPHGTVYAQIWRVQVGRVPLFLLDANLEQNAPADRRSPGRSTAAIKSSACGRRSCSASAAFTRSRPSGSRRPFAT